LTQAYKAAQITTQRATEPLNAAVIQRTGKPTPPALLVAWGVATAAEYTAIPGGGLGAAHIVASYLATATAQPLLPTAVNAFHEQRQAEARAQVALLRDVFGNPFQPVSLDPDWLASHGRNAATMAQVIYEQRRFDELPILADALEEADCPSAALVAHFRSAGPHIRGCWALDLLLGKT
jgi:hypothetical protein